MGHRIDQANRTCERVSPHGELNRTDCYLLYLGTWKGAKIAFDKQCNQEKACEVWSGGKHGLYAVYGNFENFVTLRASVLQDYRNAFWVELPDGRKTWLPYSQVIDRIKEAYADKSDSFKVTPWIARKIKEEQTSR